MEPMLNEALKKIGQVQEYDRLLAELDRRFQSIDPGGIAQARYESAKTAYEEAEARVKKIRSELADLELESKQIEQKREKEKKRLYQGGIYNAKEAEAIERELQMLKNRLSQVDERILILWEEQEPAKAELERRAQELKEAEQKLAEYREKYAQLKAEYEARRAELLKLREEATRACDPDLMKRYDHMREKHGGIGLAKVARGECSACFTKVPKLQLERIKAGQALETCENCGRYLYYLDDESE